MRSGRYNSGIIEWTEAVNIFFEAILPNAGVENKLVRKRQSKGAICQLLKKKQAQSCQRSGKAFFIGFSVDRGSIWFSRWTPKGVSPWQCFGQWNKEFGNWKCQYVWIWGFQYVWICRQKPKVLSAAIPEVEMRISMIFENGNERDLTSITIIDNHHSRLISIGSVICWTWF